MYSQIFIMLKTFARGSMKYTYERRLSPCIKSHCPPVCTVSADSFCRYVLLAGYDAVHSRALMCVLVGTSSFHSSLFTALCDTGDPRNYFFGTVGCKTVPQNRHLADDRNVFFPWGSSLFLSYRRWVVIEVGKGVAFLGEAVHA